MTTQVTLPPTLRRTLRQTRVTAGAWALACCVLGCRTPSASVADMQTPEPRPEPVCPAPDPEPVPGPPLVYDSYAVELSPASGDLLAEKHYTFVGAVVRVRARYLSEPEGDIQRSTFDSCEVEVEAPIAWREGGFHVPETVTARAIRSDFERAEQPATRDGRKATTDKQIRSCWVTLLAGDYTIDELDPATVQGRTAGFRLDDPEGERVMLRAVPAATESDLIEAVDDHFWAR